MEFYNICENNLKGIDFKANVGQLILVKGISGSGKSSLLHKVVYAECYRQEKVKKGTDDIYFHTVRPEFERCSELLPAILLEQRASRKTTASTVATKADLLTLLKKVFVEQGDIINHGQVITEKNNLETIADIRRFYPNAKIYQCISEYEEIDFKKTEQFIKKYHINNIITVDYKDRVKVSSLNNLKKIQLTNYRVLLELDIKHFSLLEKNTNKLVIRKADNEFYFLNKHIVDSFSGDILLKKNEFLFTKTTNSKNANFCRECDGKGYIKNTICKACNATGFGQETLKVFIKNKNIAELLNFTINELYVFFKDGNLNSQKTQKLIEGLRTLQKLSLGHLQLSRNSLTISAGENQRLKLYKVISDKITNHVIVLDEPSSNLSNYDIQKLFDLILELKKQNILLLIEHSDYFNNYADNTLFLGKKAGAEGGYYVDEPVCGHFEKPTHQFKENYTLALSPLHNIHIEQLDIPKCGLTAIIGSSGAGKTTLAMTLLPNALSTKNIAFEVFANEQIHNNSRSIVGTYLGVFDKVRDIFADSSKKSDVSFTKSDFSFNSNGMCQECQGHGEITYTNKIYQKKESYICPVCLGSRYRNDVSLFKVDNISIVDALNMSFSELYEVSHFVFLKNAIEIMQRLSLDHLTLGRRINSLSGGERQRLRFAEFLLSGYQKIKTGNMCIFFDEPSTGLDKQSINKMLALLHEIAHNNSVICIEHNPYFIKNTNYIIDLGNSLQLKTIDNIVVGNTDTLFHDMES